MHAASRWIVPTGSQNATIKDREAVRPRLDPRGNVSEEAQRWVSESAAQGGSAPFGPGRGQPPSCH